MARPRKIKTEETVTETEVIDGMEPAPAEDGPEPIQMEPLTESEMESLMVPRKDFREVSRREHPVAETTRESITSEQRELILREEIRKILKRNPMEGRVPALVRYTTDGSGASVYAIYDIDARVMRDIYKVYNQYAERPSVRELLNIIDEEFGNPKRRYPRLALLDWTSKVR